MKQKEVRITGLTLNQNLGIIEAHKLVFDKDNKLIIFKGAVGEGKTTEQEAIKIGIHGTKAMVDNLKYGPIDLQLQLTDGDLPFFVNRKSKGKKIQSTLCVKDKNGKIKENPIIDGVTATASSYFGHLETELTWNMPELTSDNPKVQKNILLKLYQSQLKKIGVIFDKKHLEYGTSILGKIDEAVKNRDDKDYERKKVGGIAGDLIAKGHDPDRPETCPDSIPIDNIEKEIKALEKEKTILLAAPEEKKKADLAEIKAKAGDITNKCLTYNSELKTKYEKKIIKYDEYTDKLTLIAEQKENIKKALNTLQHFGRLSELTNKNIIELLESQFIPLKKVTKPDEPAYIQFDKDNKIDESPGLDELGQDILKELNILKVEYTEVFNQDSDTNTTKKEQEFDSKIAIQERNKLDAIEINKIVDAIDSFHQWRKTDVEVARLKLEYVKLLAKVDTGVEGLKIEPVEDDIFLMYDGSYDVAYFSNPDKEMRKLSAYSGTQKPVICLLIQNYLLSKKDKAMRYMYIDNVPIDKKTRKLLEDMTEELNLHIFLNITGDFEQSKLQKGEILISGGEVFF